TPYGPDRSRSAPGCASASESGQSAAESTTASLAASDCSRVTVGLGTSARVAALSHCVVGNDPSRTPPVIDAGGMTTPAEFGSPVGKYVALSTVCGPGMLMGMCTSA